jgi:molybdopterin converting factor small subunit
MVAVNLEYVGPDFVLGERDEVAIIPPVSGGTGRRAVVGPAR